MLSFLLRSIVRAVTSLLVTALVAVPTVMRAHQHVELRDTTRLTIRLNWQSDAPPQKHLFGLDAQVQGTPSPVIDLHRPRLRHAGTLTDEPIRHSPFDRVPDTFRGPPSLFV